MSLKKKSATGTLWYMSSNGFKQTINFFVFMYLARLLEVSEFGLVAFAILIIEFVSIFLNVGVNQNLLRKPTWDDSFSSSSHWFLIGISLCIVLILLVICYPLLCLFYDKTAANIVLALSVIPVISAYRMVFNAKLQREFKNKKIALIESISMFVNGVVAIALAYAGFGPWSLVIGRVLQGLLATLMTVLISDFKPALTFSKDDVKENLEFGLPLFYIALLGFFSGKSVNMIIGVVLGPAVFALISFSRRFYEIISDLTLQSINRILTAALPRADVGELPLTYYRISRISASIIAPMYLGLGAVGANLIVLVAGEKWSDAGFLMQVLSLQAPVMILGYFLPSLLISQGLTRQAFSLKLMNMVVNVAVPAATVYFGLKVVVVAMLISKFLFFPVQFFYVSKYINLNLRTTFNFVIPFFFSGILMYLIVINIPNGIIDNDYIELLFLIVLGAVLYFTFLFSLFRKATLDTIKEFRMLRS